MTLFLDAAGLLTIARAGGRAGGLAGEGACGRTCGRADRRMQRAGKRAEGRAGGRSCVRRGGQGRYARRRIKHETDAPSADIKAEPGAR